MSQQQISKGILLTRDKLKTIEVSQDVLDQFTPDTNNYLVIFNPRPDSLKISIIPSKNREVLKILVHLTAFSPQAVKAIADIVYDLKIATVYTSGICFQEQECIYEAYVEYNEKSTVIDTIKEKFSGVTGCTGVELEVIEVE